MSESNKIGTKRLNDGKMTAKRILGNPEKQPIPECKWSKTNKEKIQSTSELLIALLFNEKIVLLFIDQERRKPQPST
jgi:hypothetical protein